MGMTKKEMEERLRRVQDLASQVTLKQRLDWLRLVLMEAEELGFNSLGELIAFMVDHEKKDHKEVKK
jgi:hypothetical protein